MTPYQVVSATIEKRWPIGCIAVARDGYLSHLYVDSSHQCHDDRFAGQHREWEWGILMFPTGFSREQGRQSPPPKSHDATLPLPFLPPLSPSPFPSFPFLPFLPLPPSLPLPPIPFPSLRSRTPQIQLGVLGGSPSGV